MPKSGGRVVVVGDAVLDVVVKPRREPVIDDDVAADVTVLPGGQGLNVARWCRYLGAETSLIAAVGADLAGRLLVSALEAERVEHLGVVVQRRSGSVVSLLGRDTERTLLSDRGAAVELSAAHINSEWFRSARHLHVSGYILLNSQGAEAALVASRMAEAAGATVSLDLGSAARATAMGLGSIRHHVAELRPSVVFGTRAEVELFGGVDAETVVVKDGRNGCVILEGGKDTRHQALPVKSPTDGTGAGDAFAAGWIVGGVDVALRAAQECVRRVGAGPPALPWKEASPL